ncbi:hypothetical protein IQ255_28440 [Pleurocapsales cyanobacterium LEGE 10410]|nr:hypothetical protein [Pleurocapsales cyanobacterium LEGE 10410]
MNSRAEIASALASEYGTDYVFLGRGFQSTVSNESCQIEISDRNTSLSRAFKLLGQNKITDATLRQIAHHRQIVYLTSSSTGYHSCLQIAKLAQVLLNIGGIAVKVESAGIAHEKDKWLAQYDSHDVFEIYSLFVGLIEGDDCYYSCGMHNFGKADVAISLTEDVGLAIYVMNVFNYYRLTESAIVQDGHTFQPDIESPTYQLHWAADNEHETDSLLSNPYGKWYLSRVDSFK